MYSFILQMLCLALLLQPMGGQSPSQKDRGEEGETIKLETTLVQVPVVVRDAGGRYVTDLARDNFILLENDSRRPIEFFGSIETPISVALVIDSSGSTKGKLGDIKAGANAFIDCLRPQDRVMVVGFDDSVHLLCDLTGDRYKLREAVAGIKSGEYTQVYEAVYTVVWEKFAEVEGKKAVVIFTDGIDTASSEISLEDTLDAVIESEEIIIYPIRYNTRPDTERKIGVTDADRRADNPQLRELDQLYRKADEYLFQLAEYSGGVVERVDELSNLPAAFARIADELRHQYVLGFYPLDRGRGLRGVVVGVNREGLRVRVRPRRQ